MGDDVACLDPVTDLERRAEHTTDGHGDVALATEAADRTGFTRQGKSTAGGDHAAQRLPAGLHHAVGRLVGHEARTEPDGQRGETELNLGAGP